MIRRWATSALDNESEQAVNEALRNLQGQKTILMIAHRPSTIELADRVCTLKQESLLDRKIECVYIYNSVI